MNKTFKVVFNRLRGKYMATDEYTTSLGKASGGCKAVVAVVVSSLVAFADASAFADTTTATGSTAATASVGQYLAFKATSGLEVSADDTVYISNSSGAIESQVAAGTAYSAANQYYLINGNLYKLQDITDPTDSTGQTVVKYFVRDGYTVDIATDGEGHLLERFTGASTNDVQGTGKNYALLYNPPTSGTAEGIMNTQDLSTSALGVKTLVGADLNKPYFSSFVGATNGGTKVGGLNNGALTDTFYLKNNGVWTEKTISVTSSGSGSSKTYTDSNQIFYAATWNSSKNWYEYNNEPVDFSDLVVLNGEVVGILSLDQGKTVYTDNILGAHNEILKTVTDGSNIYSVWTAESEYRNLKVKESDITVGQLNDAFKTLSDNDEALHGDDIKRINVNSTASDKGNITLQTNSNQEIAGLTVAASGGANGLDTSVTISGTGADGTTQSLTLATGSTVVATDATGSNTLTALTINGIEHQLAQSIVEGGTGIVVTSEETGGVNTYTVSLDSNATIGGDGKDGTLGVNGKDGKDGVSITGGAGKDGVDGQAGAIGIHGQDGKDGVSIYAVNGKDGTEGHIGLTGPAGQDGQSVSADISVKDGVAGINGKDGETMTRIVYNDGTTDHQVATLDDGLKFSADSGSTVARSLGQTLAINGDENITTTTGEGSVKVTLNKEITVNTVNATTFKAGDTTITNEGLTIKNGPSITANGINMNRTKITNIAAGDISAGSTDAVTGDQLYQTISAVEGNAANIQALNTNMNNAVRRLSRKIAQSGANAAALAALHPQDFDEDHKVTAAAGYGHYKGSNALAVGVFYRPTQNLMLNLGGSYAGNRTNHADLMVNAGLSFRFGGAGYKPVSERELRTHLTDMTQNNRSLNAQLQAANSRLDSANSKIAFMEAELAQIRQMLGHKAARPAVRKAVATKTVKAVKAVAK